MNIDWTIKAGQDPLDALDEALLDAMYGIGDGRQARDIGLMRRRLTEVRYDGQDRLMGLVIAALSGAAIMTALFTAIR